MAIRIITKKWPNRRCHEGRQVQRRYDIPLIIKLIWYSGHKSNISNIIAFKGQDNIYLPRHVIWIYFQGRGLEADTK